MHRHRIGARVSDRRHAAVDEDFDAVDEARIVEGALRFTDDA